MSVGENVMHPEVAALGVEELVAKTEAGWPRWFMRLRDGRRLPVPWINGVNPIFHGASGFTMMVPKRVEQARAERLCVVCGEQLGRVVAMGRYTGGPEGVMLTDGPPGHPRCIALAALHCPHLRRRDELRKVNADGVVAYVYDGPSFACIPVPGRDSERKADGRDVMLPRVVNPRARAVTLGELQALASADPLGGFPSESSGN